MIAFYNGVFFTLSTQKTVSQILILYLSDFNLMAWVLDEGFAN
jgi:hypothetical protein